MSIVIESDPAVETAREVVKKAKSTCDELAAKIDHAKLNGFAVRQQALHRAALELSLDQTPEAQNKYDTLAAQQANDEKQIAIWQSAQHGAAAALLQAQQELHKFSVGAQLKAGERLTAKHQTNIDALGQCVEQFGKAFRDALESGVNLRAFWPHGQVPLGSMATTNEILHALKIELFRVNAISPTERGDHLALLPGADSGMLLGAPQHIPSLSAKAAEAMAFLLRLLEAGPMATPKSAAPTPEPLNEFTAWPASEEPAPPEPQPTLTNALTYIPVKVAMSAARE